MLGANDDSLAIIADLENKLLEPEFLLLNHIRSQCATLAVDVFKAIHNLETISGKAYPHLNETLTHVGRKIESDIRPNSLTGKMKKKTISDQTKMLINSPRTRRIWRTK